MSHFDCMLTDFSSSNSDFGMLSVTRLEGNSVLSLVSRAWVHIPWALVTDTATGCNGAGYSSPPWKVWWVQLHTIKKTGTKKSGMVVYTSRASPGGWGKRIISPKLAWATQWDPASTNRQTDTQTSWEPFLVYFWRTRMKASISFFFLILTESIIWLTQALR